MSYALLNKSSLYLMFPALAPAIGGTVSVRAGVTLGLLILMVIAITGVVNMILAGRVPPGVRLVCTGMIAITVATGAGMVLGVHDPMLVESLGVFLPLLTINILIVRQIALYEPAGTADGITSDRGGTGRCRDYLRSLWLGVVCTGVLAALGAVRGVLLTGSLGGTAILAIDLSFFGEPAGVLIAVGALLAVARALQQGGGTGGREYGTDGGTDGGEDDRIGGREVFHG